MILAFDMHGKFVCDNNGNIVPVDFDIMGRLDKYNKILMEILYGFIKRDYVKVAEVHFQAGLVQKQLQRRIRSTLRSVDEQYWTNNKIYRW